MAGIPPILSIADRDVDLSLDAELRKLLLFCFPHEPQLATQRFVKESPAHRFLIRNDDGSVRAHVAVHLKTIGVGGQDVRIGGVAEVAVEQASRGQGYVKVLLGAVHAWLVQQGIHFAVLEGDPHIYRSSGYRLVGAPVRWFDHRSSTWRQEIHGLAMIRELGDQPWPEGLVDLRGPWF